MIRKNTSGDISDEEFEKVLRPFVDNYDEFVVSYIMPEVIAYYIANSYYRNAMYEGSFLQHYNSAKDLINLFGEDDPGYLLLWKNLYYCGLRIGEARGLQWKDIDWKKRTLWVNKQVQSIKNYSASYYICDTKTASSNRKIPLCDDLYDSMKEYYNSLKKYKNFNDEFFCFGNDYGITPISHPQAQRRKKVVAEKVGL